MVLDLQELNKIHPSVAGLYVITSPHLNDKKFIKLGMSITNIYKRLNSYVNCFGDDFTIHALFLMRNKTQKEKEQIRQAETYARSLLNPAPLKTRMFPTRIEIFDNSLEEVVKALEKTRIKYQALWFDAHWSGKIEFDDRLHVVKKIIGEKKDDVGIWYQVEWDDGSRTWERRSTLEGEDKQGKWIVGVFAKYLKSKGKK